MSVSNDGVSRFVPSTVYAPTTFAGGITSAGITSGSMVCNTIDAEAVKMTLNTNVGLYLSGGLSSQDLLPVGAVVYATPLPFMCVISLGGGSGGVTLPPAYAGARIIFCNTSAGNRIITAFGAENILNAQTGGAAHTLTLANFQTAIFCKTDGPTWLAIIINPVAAP